MPLSILIALVVGGIAGIAVLTHLAGFSSARRFGDAEAVRAAWAREFATVPVTAVTLCQTGNAALVSTPNGPGIVWAMGADSTARLLIGAQVRSHGDGLTVTLPDYTAPKIRLRLDPRETEEWRAQIGATA
ncbi:hypothetical protein KUH32_05725 [Thalassococcus sp. CAU 1522]|uniref:Uncharacterized protein n=1 Tax=Thalassococcus arenae TaxID=2851652 RepID=A0ABS6N5G0_9RHOB|nr:hypothetical protein [Thalassococcus arenae]MBV2359261.1 hypothetical protein [Thalassococcus arenae]